jgi:hypothetical protein
MGTIHENHTCELVRSLCLPLREDGPIRDKTDASQSLQIQEPVTIVAVPMLEVCFIISIFTPLATDLNFTPKTLRTRFVQYPDFLIAIIIDPFATGAIWAMNSPTANLWRPAFHWLFQNVDTDFESPVR